MHKLTRAEAHEAVELIDDRRLLAVAWDVPGHWNEHADWNSDEAIESLHDFVDQAAEDGTALTLFVDGIPTKTGERALFASWEAFVERLWAETPEEFRNEATDPDDFAQGCLLSQNGVFTVTEVDSGIVVENVG